ncbi:MAG: hypothetical protein LR011_11785 [Verrucomicrobia bacterium]|nr:hypothetical protein [Verrucomicrobiota bacterium]
MKLKTPANPSKNSISTRTANSLKTSFVHKADPRGRTRGEDGPRGPGQGGPNLETLVNRILANDKNGDGKIEVSEVEARMAGIVRRADSNQDGFATREELSTLFANETGRPNRDDRPQRGPGRPE